MLTKNSILASFHKKIKCINIGRLVQPDSTVKLYYIKWDTNDDYDCNHIGPGFELTQIELNLSDNLELSNFKTIILNSEKELLEFRLRHG